MKSLEAHETASRLDEETMSVGFRAEALKRCGPEHVDAIPCRVRLLEQMGNETLVFLESDATDCGPIAMRLDRNEGKALSENMALFIRPDWRQALFFDNEGKRVWLAREASKRLEAA